MNEYTRVIFVPVCLFLVLCLAYVSIPGLPTLNTHTLSTSNLVRTESTCVSCPSTTTCSSETKPVLGGLDLVQYFTDFKLADGTYDETRVGSSGVSTYTSIFNGFQFQFQSKENKDLFDASPTSYIPQYGGFCGWGIAAEVI